MTPHDVLSLDDDDEDHFRDLESWVVWADEIDRIREAEGEYEE